MRLTPEREKLIKDAAARHFNSERASAFRELFDEIDALREEACLLRKERDALREINDELYEEKEHEAMKCYLSREILASSEKDADRWSVAVLFNKIDRLLMDRGALHAALEDVNSLLKEWLEMPRASTCSLALAKRTREYIDASSDKGRK